MLQALRERLRPFYLRRIYFPLHPERKPEYFNRCWDYPEWTPSAPEAQRTMVLILPMSDWHARIQRTQHFALGLSRRGFQCVYLNPHLGREFPAGFDRASPTRVTQLHPDLLELHVHLPREPVFHHRMLSAAESEQIARAVSELIARARPANVVQLLAFPVWFPAALRIRERHGAPIVYDCHDFLPGFTGIAPAIAQEEAEMFRQSDAVVCSSTALLRRAEEFGARAPALIHNAASAELLRGSRNTRSSILVGYIGALDRWFDIASLENAARMHPDWRFQLIGRIEWEGFRTLQQFPNVEFCGEIPFDQLPSYLSSFTVAVIPFLLNELIAATDPIKAYEYLAAGLPVLAADLPELQRLGNLLSRYRDSADFVIQLEKAIANDSESKSAERRSAMQCETWDHRVEQLATEIRGQTRP